MSRSGYNDCGDIEQWDLIRWRGAVASALRGRRGQAFLREMAAAMDAMPVRELIADDIVREDGQACAIGTVARARGMDVTGLDPEDRETVADRFGIARAMVAEVVFENDEGGHSPGWDEVERCWRRETPEQRFDRMRAWVASQIREDGP